MVTGYGQVPARQFVEAGTKGVEGFGRALVGLCGSPAHRGLRDDPVHVLGHLPRHSGEAFRQVTADVPVRVGPFGGQIGEGREGVLQRCAALSQRGVEHVVHERDGCAPPSALPVPSIPWTLLLPPAPWSARGSRAFLVQMAHQDGQVGCECVSRQLLGGQGAEDGCRDGALLPDAYRQGTKDLPAPGSVGRFPDRPQQGGQMPLGRLIGGIEYFQVPLGEQPAVVRLLDEGAMSARALVGALRRPARMWTNVSRATGEEALARGASRAYQRLDLWVCARSQWWKACRATSARYRSWACSAMRPTAASSPAGASARPLPAAYAIAWWWKRNRPAKGSLRTPRRSSSPGPPGPCREVPRRAVCRGRRATASSRGRARPRRGCLRSDRGGVEVEDHAQVEGVADQGSEGQAAAAASARAWFISGRLPSRSLRDGAYAPA